MFFEICELTAGNDHIVTIASPFCNAVPLWSIGDSMDVYQTQRVTPLARSPAHEISKNMAAVRPWEEGFDGNS